MNERLPKLCVATIVSANYLAYARVLGESLARFHSSADFKVLIVDRATPETLAAVAESGLDATFAGDLGLPDFESIAFKFDVVELNTALKPTFLKRQFAEGYGQVVYLDPDIRLYRSLAPVEDALAEHQIVLIPHTLSPALDGSRPSDIDFLRSGAYNLGFIALRAGADTSAMLDWWEDRCLAYGFNDLVFGTFVDQKWIDLVPSYFGSVKVLRDSTCNVAYWNLHERTVSGDAAGNYWIGDAPLTFFHFSGVKAEAPAELSRHQTRHRLVPGSPVAALVADYCAALLDMGHARFKQLGYTFGVFSNGEAIDSAARKASTFVESNGRPFAADGPLRAALSASRILQKPTQGKPAQTNTLNFDEADRKVVLVNRLVRGLARTIGVSRLEALLKYAAFLTRESNYTRVLLRKPFDLRHERRRDDGQ